MLPDHNGSVSLNGRIEQWKVHWRSTGVVRWSVYGCVSYAVGVVLCFAQLIIKVERVNCIFDIVGVNSLYALSVHAMHAGKQ